MLHVKNVCFFKKRSTQLNKAFTYINISLHSIQTPAEMCFFFLPFRQHPVFHPPTYTEANHMHYSPSCSRCTPVHIKHIIALTQTWLHVFFNNNIVYSCTAEARWQSCLVLYRSKALPPAEVPYHLYVIYLFYLSLSVTSRLLFSSPCVRLVWCFSFSLSEVVSGVQRWKVYRGFASHYWRWMKVKTPRSKHLLIA